MTQLQDPPAPPEAGESQFLKAKDLKNLPLIVQPTAHKIEDGQDGKPWEFVECNVWVLDRAGIVQSDEGVRFSWYRVLSQLRQMMGEYIACRPVQHDDNSVTLEPLQGAARGVASDAIAEIVGAASADATPTAGAGDQEPLPPVEDGHPHPSSPAPRPHASQTDYENWKHPELVAMCAERGITTPANATKARMVALLREDDELSEPF